jgi:hypothetical protein
MHRPRGRSRSSATGCSAYLALAPNGSSRRAATVAEPNRYTRVVTGDSGIAAFSTGAVVTAGPSEILRGARNLHRFVSPARSRGIELTGPGGLLSRVTQALETALGAELDELCVMIGVSDQRRTMSTMAAHLRWRAPMSAESASRCLRIGSVRSLGWRCPSIRTGSVIRGPLATAAIG